jgi:hypothetical protein
MFPGTLRNVSRNLSGMFPGISQELSRNLSGSLRKSQECFQETIWMQEVF